LLLLTLRSAVRLADLDLDGVTLYVRPLLLLGSMI
jgi:hypothetical protein